MQKVNYQLQLDGITANLTGKPSLLLHSCCGPCSSYVIEYLSKFFQITVYYYNPNIHPKEEYLHRLETQRQLVEKLGGAVLVEGEYEPSRYFDAVRGYEDSAEGGERCNHCIEERLVQTAQKCKEGGYDYFATTLTVSPHKNAQSINKIGFELSQKFGIKWLPSDFKKREGYKRSIELSAEYGLYRQDYCGCIFSLQNKN